MQTYIGFNVFCLTENVFSKCYVILFFTMCYIGFTQNLTLMYIICNVPMVNVLN